MKPGFMIQIEGKPSAQSVDIIAKLLKQIQKDTPIRHRVGVLILNSYVLSHSNAEVKTLSKRKMNKAIAGLFIPKKSKKHFGLAWIDGCDCQIILPGRLPYLWNRTKPSWMALIWTTMHEVIHYQQYRNHKKLQEEGVEEKVDRILKRLGYDT